MQKFLFWLHTHKWVCVLAIFVYSLFIVFMHSSFVYLSIIVMNYFSLPLYNWLVTSVLFVFLGTFIYFIFNHIRKYKHPIKSQLLYLVVTLVLIIIHFITLFEMNIEIIHVLEYAGLAVLFYVLFARAGAAIIFSIPIMLWDEWRQYVILYPSYVQYFELNDIVIDILGSGFVLVSLSVFGISIKSNSLLIWKLPELHFLFTLILATIFSFNFGWIVDYQSEVQINTVFIMNKMSNHFDFWNIHPFTKAQYHILSPNWGVSIILVLSLFYISFDRITEIYTSS